jgi:hypothetical protein
MKARQFSSSLTAGWTLGAPPRPYTTEPSRSTASFRLPRGAISGREQMQQTCACGSVTHSITSSAMASRPGGKLSPNALAVLRLIANSNLVDCMTGKSAGFWPLRIRPA